MSEQARNLRRHLNKFQQAPGSIWTPQIKRGNRPCVTLAVSSGKGGVGKTNFSLNLSLLLKELNYRVLLVDADLGLANIDILLGISPSRTLADFLFKNSPLETIIYTGPKNLEILPAKNGLQSMAQLEPDRISKLSDAFSNLEKTYDYIIFDTSAGIQLQTTSFVLSSKEVILLLTPEPTSFVDVYSMVKVIHKNQPGKKINIVVNMTRSPKEGEEQFNKLDMMSKKFLKKKLTYLGFLPYDNQVRRSVKDQNPIVIQNPNSQFSEKLTAVRDNWTHQENYVHQYSLSDKFKKILTFGHKT